MISRKSILLTVLCCLVSGIALAGVPQLESNLSFRRFTTIDGLPQMQTETVWQDDRGYIYIGTLSGFVRYDGVSMTPFLGGRRENIVQFREVSGDVRAMGFVRQWDICGKGLRQSDIDPDGVLLLNNLNSADLPSDLVLLEDRQERNRVLCRIDDGDRQPLLESPLLDQMTPDRKMYVDSVGIFIPTAEGLFRNCDGTVRRLSRKADVFSLVRTGSGLLAFASDGIYRVASDSLSPVCAHRFEAPDYGLYVRQNRQGNVIIADSHTIWIYDGITVRQLASGFNMIKGVFVDGWNRLWVATYQGAYCFFHCNFTTHRLTDRNDIVRAIGVCGSSMVMGTLNGKVLVDGQLIEERPEEFYAPGAAVIGNTVYMAGNGDVVAVEVGAGAAGSGDAAASVRRLGLPYDRYRFVSRDASGRLVIGASRSVLSYDPSTARLDTLTMETGRPWCAVDDGQGHIWVSGNPGLFCITGQDVRKAVSTKTAQIVTTIATDGRGLVCYALGDALYCIRAGGEPLAVKEVQPLLSGHEVRSVHISSDGCLVAAAIDGLVVARMSDDGHASDVHWFDASNGFTSIEPLLGTMAETPEGTVWLAGLEDMTSFRPSDLLADNQQSTVVKAPLQWWQRWWVWLTGILLLSFGVWRAAAWFEKRRARRRLAELEREKKQKELQLSAVRLKAIPHFHANVLSGIEYFIMNKSADEATHYLKLYSDFTNQTLCDIDRPCRSVSEEVDYIRKYLELEKLRYGERLQYSISVDPEVDRNQMVPTMLLHTYSQNAVKHGIASKEGPGCVEVSVVRSVREGVDGVMITVKDDGVGRKAAARTGGYSTGQGLKILRQQIELFNQTNVHHIVQRVTDLVDADGRPAGTSFETWIPTDYQY